MKKVLSVVLAVAMVLACVASLAFVLDNQTGITTATNSALKVEGFYVTDDASMKSGIMVYSDLTELHGAPYDRNSVIRFAVELAVYNSTNPTNGVVPTANNTNGGANQYNFGNLSTLIFESDTVDFTLAQTGMVLYKPYVTDSTLPYFSNMVQAVVGTSANGVEVSEDGHTMELDVYYYTTDYDGPDRVSPENVTQWAGFDANGLHLYGVSDNPTTVKTDYTLVLTGVTVGALDQEGLVTLQRQDTAGDTFADNNGDGEVIVEKNGRTYKIWKFYAENSRDPDTTMTDGSKYWNGSAFDDAHNSLNPRGDFQWLDRMVTDYNANADLYDVNAVGYLVSVLVDDNGTETTSDDVYGIIGRFETEQVRYGAIWGEELEGKDAEGYGVSLGLDYWDADATTSAGTRGAWRGVWRNYLEAFQPYYISTDDASTNYREEVYVSGRNGEPMVNLNDFTAAIANTNIRDALDTFLSDFGFGTGTEYSYKVVDANFTNEGTFEQLGTADYNGNAIVIPQPEEDDDVEEGTGDEEIPDEGDIDEELPDEGDIDEEPIPDEPVPETGDASAAVAVALTAAALVAAAGLAVVLKKAR